MRPFALHITWTAYSTWLPGDGRGYVSNTRLPRGGFEPKQNAPGTPYTKDDATTRGLARGLQKWPTVWLTREQAGCAVRAIVRAATARGWVVLRAAAMVNHIHVVVAECPDDGPAVRRVLKGASQAALSELVGESRRWWTASGSDRYKYDQPAIDAAVDYVAKQPGMLAGFDGTYLFVRYDPASGGD